MPNILQLRSAYHEFDAGTLARESFARYVEIASSILRNELSTYLGRDGAGVTFLDYGCGGGHFVEAARRLGMSACGMELDNASVSYGRRLGLEIAEGIDPGPQSELRDRTFNFVRSMHVLEHTTNPVSIFASLSMRLTNGGLLVIGVPDQESFASRLKIWLRNFGVKYSEFGFVQPPIHLHGFTSRALQILGEAHGLQVVKILRTSPLDIDQFPSTAAYWGKLRLHRAIYSVGKALGSPGHLLGVFRKP